MNMISKKKRNKSRFFLFSPIIHYNKMENIFFYYCLQKKFTQQIKQKNYKKKKKKHSEQIIKIQALETNQSVT